MASKRIPNPKSRARSRTKRAAPASSSSSIRMPQSSRVVTARKLRTRANENRGRAPRREVPEIRLSGAWLERVGFAKGVRYLISAERPHRTLILQAAMPRLRDRRGRGSA